MTCHYVAPVQMARQRRRLWENSTGQVSQKVSEATTDNIRQVVIVRSFCRYLSSISIFTCRRSSARYVLLHFEGLFAPRKIERERQICKHTHTHARRQARQSVLTGDKSDVNKLLSDLPFPYSSNNIKCR